MSWEEKVEEKDFKYPEGRGEDKDLEAISQVDKILSSMTAPEPDIVEFGGKPEDEQDNGNNEVDYVEFD